MPPKRSSNPSPKRPRKTPASKTTSPEPLPEQTDLFGGEPTHPPQKKASAASARKPSKPRATASTTATSPARKTTNTPIVANTKQYIQKIPYIGVLVIGYVVVVLALDAMVTVGDSRTVNWAFFSWHLSGLKTLLEHLSVPKFLIGWMSWSVFAKVDLFKMLFWLIIPVGLSLWRMDWGYITKHRIQPVDWQFLIGMCVLALGAIVSVKFIPELARLYHGLGDASLSARMQFFFLHLFWVVSWLPGWEFMHRYFLLRRVTVDFPRFGWILVPVAEGAYHLVKPWPEMLAMVAFSVIMTQYTMRRKNIVIPFLAHLAVEVLLIIGMIVW